jgi:hypothetical protein
MTAPDRQQSPGENKAVGTVQRAYELAPFCGTVEQIRIRLKREGYSMVEEHLSGTSIRSDLRKLLDRNISS